MSAQRYSPISAAKQEPDTVRPRPAPRPCPATPTPRSSPGRILTRNHKPSAGVWCWGVLAVWLWFLPPAGRWRALLGKVVALSEVVLLGGGWGAVVVLSSSVTRRASGTRRRRKRRAGRLRLRRVPDRALHARRRKNRHLGGDCGAAPGPVGCASGARSRRGLRKTSTDFGHLGGFCLRTRVHCR
jgi:hypothetical protein